MDAKTELHTVNFIREHGIDELVAKFRLKKSIHAEHPHLVLLKYEQVHSMRHQHTHVFSHLVISRVIQINSIEL